MTKLEWIGLGLGCTVLAYALIVAALIFRGRQQDARALVRFIPDCIVLVSRLLGDPGVSRVDKLLLGAVAAYLALPVDLVPDFIPGAGQADDALVVALVLRRVLRASGAERLRRHWPGPPNSLALVLRLAGAPSG